LGQRVQELMSRPTCGVNEVLEVIEADPAVLSRVLRVSNSAAYAGQGSITTPKAACMRLGNHEALSVARDAILGAMFHLDGTPLEEVARDAWRNVIVTARTARDLADLLCIGEPDAVHTAALLHNVGELIFLRLASQLPADPAGPDATMAKLEGPIQQLHEPIGAKVLSSWGVPDELVRIAGTHHDLTKCKDEEHELQAAVVQLAWASACRAGYGQANTDEVDFESLRELVGASEKELDSILAKAPEWLENAGA
jgi:HD-like signal output (HDOD) protein